ncbi:hypothetical protein DPEC_G00251520 [Dallia pectoralis]|uniref:Uncharacterized protein n=1 Tax=Dallia pectoralis TaxID=75939 RepID=A0ACC2FTR2_DALPE|nr:hypothetical protein DPEC_G00251520 [Dallia pectoralis]
MERRESGSTPQGWIYLGLPAVCRSAVSQPERGFKAVIGVRAATRQCLIHKSRQASIRRNRTVPEARGPILSCPNVHQSIRLTITPVDKVGQVLSQDAPLFIHNVLC